MSLAAFGTLLSVWFAAIASPGPDVFQIIRVGSRSRSAGVRCALGIMVGNSLWIIGSLVGLSALVNTHPGVLDALKIGGGAYLSWMGFNAVRAGINLLRRGGTPNDAHSDQAPHAPAAANLSPWRALRIGIATNLANPKALVFFGAVFAQFVTPGISPATNAVIAVTLIVTGIAWFVGVALMVGAFAHHIARYGHVIELATGVIFIVLGSFMLYNVSFS